MNPILRNHPYWVFMNPFLSRKNGRDGSEYHDFFINFKMGEHYVIHPMSLMIDEAIVKLFLEQLGVDPSRFQYKVEHDLFISFKEKNILTLFVLAFRESCTIWRED